MTLTKTKFCGTCNFFCHPSKKNVILKSKRLTSCIM